MSERKPTEKSWVEQALDAADDFTPKTGYNVVAVDAYAMPGEGLYLVGHFDTEAEAEKARAAHAKESGDTSYVYGPDDEDEDDED